MDGFQHKKNGERPKSAGAKVVTGMLVMVFLEVVLAGCPPRKPTPIAHDDSYASYARPKTVLSAGTQGISPAVKRRSSPYADEDRG